MTGLDLATSRGVIAELDRAIDELRDGEQAWAGTSLQARRELLLELGESARREAASWVERASRIKQLDSSSSLVGEEWISGPYALLCYVAALAETLRSLESGADVLADYRFDTAPGGRTSIEVLPHGTFDRLLLSGYRASVWTRPGVGADEVRAGVGLPQRAPRETRGVVLVLGAGNITSIAPLDVLYQLYAENRVALLKVNPVLDPLRPILERVFAPFVRRKLVRIVAGGPVEGAYLAEHARIDAVHITGSVAAHDAIVFGPGAEGTARKAEGRPRLSKPITSELGNVSPVIIVPDRWSESDLRYQAEHVATQKLHNAGHNCVATQLVLLRAPGRKSSASSICSEMPSRSRQNARPGTTARPRARTRQHRVRGRRVSASGYCSPG
jgi:acyl-CoA reductase-like NAD-dependent aldehyde dehydrogenase